MIVEPLHKRKKDGTLYTRPVKIQVAIELAQKWTFEEFLEKAKVKKRSDPEYIPSEVLVYYIRLTKLDNYQTRFENLYTILLDRVRNACPRPNIHVGNMEVEIAKLAEIRDLITEYVIDLILLDRQTYCEKLDFLEVRFDRAIRYLRIDRFKRVGKKEDHKISIEYDETGDIPIEVEEAFASFKEAYNSEEEKLTYRINLRQAIDGLPDKERKVIEMLLTDLPIESTDPTALSICKILNCSEKTVRNRRNRAHIKIKKALEMETHND